MAMDNDDVISVLNNLIETCEDGVKGFRDAAEAIGNPRAREVFNSRIDLIERAESDLKAAVRRLGGDQSHLDTVRALSRNAIDEGARAHGPSGIDLSAKDHA